MRLSKADFRLLQMLQSLKQLLAVTPDDRALAQWLQQNVITKASPNLLAMIAGAGPVSLVEPKHRKSKKGGGVGRRS